jgi:hypothetical protein
MLLTSTVEHSDKQSQHPSQNGVAGVAGKKNLMLCKVYLAAGTKLHVREDGESSW